MSRTASARGTARGTWPWPARRATAHAWATALGRLAVRRVRGPPPRPGGRGACNRCHNWFEDRGWRLTAASPDTASTGRADPRSLASAVTAARCIGGPSRQGLRGFATPTSGSVGGGRRGQHRASAWAAIASAAAPGTSAQPSLPPATQCHSMAQAPRQRPGRHPGHRLANALHARARCDLCHGLHGHRGDRRLPRHACDGCQPPGLRSRPQPAGHADCARCHPPHAPTGKAIQACAECHGSGWQGRQVAASGRRSGTGLAPTATSHTGGESCRAAAVTATSRSWPPPGPASATGTRSAPTAIRPR